MRRRDLLSRLIGWAGLLASAAIPLALGRALAPASRRFDQQQHLRPPGAIGDDAAFVEACIGCGLCGEVCPPQCIVFHQRDGGSQVSTPYINPEIKACTLCGKCMQACPTDALTATAPREVAMGTARIDRTACYPWVDRGICGACVSICPLGESAIGFELWNQYRPDVRSGCVGCGLCVEVCPHPSLPIRIVEHGLGTVVQHAISA